MEEKESKYQKEIELLRSTVSKSGYQMVSMSPLTSIIIHTWGDSLAQCIVAVQKSLMQYILVKQLDWYELHSFPKWWPIEIMNTN